MDTLLTRPNKGTLYCSSIKSSDYVQGENKLEREQYSTLIELFLSCYDPAYSLLDHKDKELYILQKVTQISADIDERKDKLYDAFAYSKKFKPSLIQKGLQVNDSVSSLLYFNDLFSIETIVVNLTTHKYIVTTNKKRAKFCITKVNDKWMHLDGYEEDGLSEDAISVNESFSEGSFSDLGDFLVMDYNDKHIHKPYLGPVGTYKVQELQDIAEGMNIPLDDNGKKKTKKRLYDEINVFQLNLI